MKRVLVTGAGGFIGHHLVQRLKADGCWVRGVDIKYPEFEPSAADEFLIRDLRSRLSADDALAGGFDEVYALAADMGGMGFISFHGADILQHNTLINLNTIEAARHAPVGRYLFTSSACVYPEHLQLAADVRPLKEADALPAWPDTDYGWEKLYAERQCLAYARDWGMTTRMVRFHNVYGPLGTWAGGREKAPAALCRKIAGQVVSAERGVDVVYPYQIEVWGDGEQTRSFLYVDDAVEGVLRVMRSHYAEPLNIGSDKLISINDLAYTIARIAKADIEIIHVDGPQGVRGRNSDNTLSKAVLDWEPQRSLDGGLELTYQWIYEQVKATLA